MQTRYLHIIYRICIFFLNINMIMIMINIFFLIYNIICQYAHTSTHVAKRKIQNTKYKKISDV